MRHILDYIEEECAGCATPGNTMGMGNPMPPTEEAPGSEPLCGKCKKEKKKKKVTESILDDDLGENLDEQIIANWFKEHSTSRKYRSTQCAIRDIQHPRENPTSTPDLRILTW